MPLCGLTTRTKRKLLFQLFGNEQITTEANVNHLRFHKLNPIVKAFYCIQNVEYMAYPYIKMIIRRKPNNNSQKQQLLGKAGEAYKGFAAEYEGDQPEVAI